MLMQIKCLNILKACIDKHYTFLRYVLFQITYKTSIYQYHPANILPATNSPITIQLSVANDEQ